MTPVTLIQAHRPVLATLAVLTLTATPCLAGEAYLGAGLPGVMLGYAQAVSDQLTLRADYATLGRYRKDGNEEGINYIGRVKVGRLGLFADYFPLGGAGQGFRLTGGLTLNRMKGDLLSDFHAGDVITVGNTVVVVPTNNLYFNVHIKVPDTTPYLGIGWGHRDQTKGWGLVADLGASIGKAKVTVDTNVTTVGVSQADVDDEIRQIRDGVGKIRVIPQLSLAVSYRF